MNNLDIAIIAVLALCALSGYYRGFVHTVYRLGSLFLAIFLAVRLYPPVARFLRGSFIYENIRDRIISAANFESVFRENAPSPGIGEAVRNNNIINALPLPYQLRQALHNYNTPDMYEILRVRTVEEFIAGFFANIVINVISLLVVFLLVMLILRIVGKALKIVDRLPVIASVNRIGGLVAGALIGVGVVWLGLTVLTMFFSTGGNATIYGLMQGSGILGWMLGNGWLLPRITVV